MDTKLQLTDKLKTATNILVTVSNNPSVDQLAACIAMTLWLNKSGKHATAVFSGDIPNTLEFLQPEATLEKTTDSLRDFIIALDKSKADKLRYKVEDRVVKIFITPYRTSLSADDLEFSQGDFNVDAIVAIGVTKQEDLDQAIVSHGRILHDAVVTTINTSNEGGLGSVNWHDPSASSLSELAYDLCQALDAKDIDPQIATALLTGIVAETDRFSNNKTTPNTMSVAAALMGAGANQQLVSNKLEEGDAAKPISKISDHAAEPSKSQGTKDDGTLEIEHEVSAEEKPEPKAAAETKQHQRSKDKEKISDVKGLPDEPLLEDEITKDDSEEKAEFDERAEPPNEPPSSRIVTEPPQMGGMLTANSRPDDMNPEPVTDPLSLPPVDTNQLLKRETSTPGTEPRPKELESSSAPTNQQPPPGPGPEASKDTPESKSQNDQTLSDIEKAVDSPHLNNLRDQVDDAFNADKGPADDDQLKFNPADFIIEEHDDSADSSTPGAGAPPPVAPPPVVPPDFLPPKPPAG